MNIIKEQKDKALTLIIEGGLDLDTAPDLEQVLDENYDSIDTLCLDFDKLEYISSAGIRVLIQARKAMKDKGEYKIINVSSIVYDVLEMTGCTKMMTIEEKEG